MQTWTIENIWNETITQKQRPPKPRNYIWAGDLGKNLFDRYHKMIGTEPTEKTEERVLRKFSAGIWFEEMIGYVLKQIGIIEAKQDWLEIPAHDGLLRITGKLDFLAGGNPDWTIARGRIIESGFPDFVQSVALKLVDYFEKQYPEGLEQKVIEVKSVNSQVFWAKKDYLEEAYPWHILQLYTYLKAKNISKGTILYISKDDLTVKEFNVNFPDPNIESAWLGDVMAISKFYNDKIEPPKPPWIVFDKRKKLHFQYEKKKHTIIGCWTSNFEVGWSPYFSFMTGEKSVEAWEIIAGRMASAKNKPLKEDYISKLKIPT